MGKFVIRETKTGFTFRLKAGNGEIIGVSETYKALDSCKNGIASVAKNAPVAAVEDQTVEGFEKAKNPKFEIYTDKAGELRFRLKAGNGEIILASEGYSSMSGCKNGIESVRKNADSETVMEEA
ncbi:MAG: YegP family protein [Firmicutes bacterium]|nr:YegP family protein [Bacillota bacterium]